ncbi:MAG: FHIPEP family type III secretion protein [Treponema sp.]|nr:FHIPEP family type III secretion protein [Treponema sp.]
MKKTPFCIAGDGEAEPPVERLFTSESLPADPALPALNSYILFCDVYISGKDTVVGLKYAEENMFAPMIVSIERDASADAVVRAAEAVGVPVINNIMLAKNLISYGKAGESIPEAFYRDVSMLFARLDSHTPKRRVLSVKAKKLDPAVRSVRPLSIELGELVFELIGEGSESESLIVPLNALRKKLSCLLGFSVPAFRTILNPKLKEDEYRILFKGLEAGRGRLEMGWYSAICAARALSDDSISNAELPASCMSDLVNNSGNIKLAAKAVSHIVLVHIHKVVQERTPDFLGRDEVQAILDTAEETYPVVTGEVKNLLTLGVIREIFQGLVSEQVSIRHMPIILETLADWAGFGHAPSELIIEQVRQALKRQICLDYADENLTLRVLTLNSKMESDFISSVMSSSSGGLHSVPGDWEGAISSAYKRMVDKGFHPVILCSPKLRTHIKEATRRQLPYLAVLSYMEIPPDITLEPVGEISLKKARKG